MGNQKKLIIMNGRFFQNGKNVHAFVAANSKADANSLLQQASKSTSSFVHEISEYFSIGCWGNPMDGIKIERGVWVQNDRETPKRII